MTGTLVLAHRGDHRGHVENTLDALVAGAGLPGVDGVELDVRVAADGVPVVLHDASLARTFGVAAAVGEHPAAELTRHGVPLLADVLAALPRDAFVDIELKERASAATLDVIAAARGERGPGGGLHRAVVSCFDPAVLREVGARAPGWPRWLNAVSADGAVVAAAAGAGIAGIAVAWRAVTVSSVVAAHAAGLTVAAWTITRRPTRRRLASLGVDVLIVEGAALTP